MCRIVPSTGIGKQSVVPAAHTPPGNALPTTLDPGSGVNVAYNLEIPGWKRNIPGRGGPTKTTKPAVQAHS